jgi:hypothetical protein
MDTVESLNHSVWDCTDQHVDSTEAIDGGPDRGLGVSGACDF